MATFEKIATVDVGLLGAASIDFTSIPSTFTDLCIKLSVRNTNPTGGTFQNLFMAFNGVSTGYSGKNLQGNGSAAQSASSSDSYQGAVVVSNSGTTANTFSNIDIYIPNYAGSSQKSVATDGVTESNITAMYMSMMAFLSTGTAAVTSIALTTNPTFSFAQYSTATLYGIKKA